MWWYLRATSSLGLSNVALVWILHLEKSCRGGSTDRALEIVSSASVSIFCGFPGLGGPTPPMLSKRSVVHIIVCSRRTHCRTKWDVCEWYPAQVANMAASQ